jgi:hypothetical protein
MVTGWNCVRRVDGFRCSCTSEKWMDLERLIICAFVDLNWECEENIMSDASVTAILEVPYCSHMFGRKMHHSKCLSRL